MATVLNNTIYYRIDMEAIRDRIYLLLCYHWEWHCYYLVLVSPVYYGSEVVETQLLSLNVFQTSGFKDSTRLILSGPLNPQTFVRDYFASKFDIYRMGRVMNRSYQSILDRTTALIQMDSKRSSESRFHLNSKRSSESEPGFDLYFFFHQLYEEMAVSDDSSRSILISALITTLLNDCI